MSKKNRRVTYDIPQPQKSKQYHVTDDSHGLIIQPIINKEVVVEKANEISVNKKNEIYQFNIDYEKVRSEFPKFTIRDKIQITRYILHKVDMCLMMNDDKKTRNYMESRSIIGYMLKVIDYEYGQIHDIREREKYERKIRELRIVYDALDSIITRNSIRSFFCLG